MTARLALDLTTSGIERVAAELAVAFCFEGDRPLRGDAGRSDWRLCGDLSALLDGRGIRGEPGDALLVPTEGRLRADRLLLLGLGPAEGFGPDACARAVRDAVERVLDLRVASAALGTPGAWADGFPVGIGAQACLRGSVAALEGRDAALEITLLTTTERVSRVLRGLEAAAEDMSDRQVRILLPQRERVAAPPPPTRSAAPQRGISPQAPPNQP